MQATLLLPILLIINGVYSQSDCTYGDINSNYVTFCDLNNTLRAQLQEVFDATPFHDFIGKVVRLIFHDCMGPKEHDMTGTVSICDGCISFTNGAHKGLAESAVGKLEKIYTSSDNNWFNRISRADFWAAAATMGLEYSNYLSMTTDIHDSTANPDESLPYIPFYIGRVDCSAAPDVNIANYPTPYQSFPDALGGWSHNYNLFQTSFGFTEQEYTAILGAHTLGRVHHTISGFGTETGTGSPWVQAWDILDNEFYHVLLDDEIRHRTSLNWQQQENNNDDGVLRHEWRSTDQSESESRFVMLNADMALVKDLDNNFDTNTGGGKCTCTYSNCPDNNISITYVEEYADDNQLWLTDFGNAFRKMIINGYDNININPSDLTVLAEDEYLNENNITQNIVIIRCDPPTDYSNTYYVERFRERTMGQTYVDMATADFLAANTNCVTNTDPTVLYKFDYLSRPDNQLTVNLVICCGDGATWTDGYVFPSGYQLDGAFMDDDYIDFGDDDPQTMLAKQIAVYCIAALIVIVCCGVIGYVLWRKHKRGKYKKRKLERNMQETHDINSNNKEEIAVITTSTFEE